jgi:pimeloyl-ACP methyl ester carboxylesterase
MMPKLTRENVTLHYEIEGTGQPVVYICGFSDHSNSAFSTGIRQSLAEKYHVLTLDNRGAGQTLVDENTPVSIADMADDVAAVMNATGISQAPILGISMGGYIALTLALRHPDKVKNLVVAVSAVRTETPSRAIFVLETTQAMIMRGLPQEFINRYTATYLLSEATFKHERFMQAWVNAPQDPLRQAQQGFVQQKHAVENYDIRDKVKAITIPILVVSSPDDLLVPPHFQDEIVAHLPHSDIKHYTGGHVFMGLPMYKAPFFEDVFAFWEQN